MREIKFRAWDRENKKWFEWEELRKTPFLPCVFRDYDIVQFTGLYDKNGKEIYEGDIVKWKFTAVENPPYYGCVVYEECEFIINNTAFYGYEGAYFCWSELEVIGNIYENPELVKGC